MELIVVVGIIVLLATMTIAVFNTTLNSDRIRGAARQVQSAVLGAKDRSMQFKEIRGIRLVVDPNDPTVANSIVFLDAPQLWSEGQLMAGRNGSGGAASTSTVNLVRGYDTGWTQLYLQGLITNGSRIRIPASGNWYTVFVPTQISGVQDITTNPPVNTEIMQLTVSWSGAVTNPFGQTYSVGPDTVQGSPGNTEPGWIFSDDTTDIHATAPLTYQLELAPAQSAGESPMVFPKGIVIDLDNSDIPTGWMTTNTPPYSATNPKYITNMDIMFSPRGSITGPLAAKGLVHLLLAETKDTDQRSTLSLIGRTGEQLIVTVFTRTGNVSTHLVDLTDSPPDGIPDDLFNFAKSGALAGK